MRDRLLCLGVAAVLIAGCGAPGVHAAGEDEAADLRLYGTAEAGPIGAVGAYGELTVNGRRAPAGHALWGGELLYAPAGRGGRADLGALGRVALERGAAVRLARGAAGPGGEGAGAVLVASVVTGRVRIELARGAGAYVEAGGGAYSAAAGARVEVEVGEGAARVEALSGAVLRQEQGAKQIYKLRPIDLGAAINVAARSTRQVQVQVTDANDKPVPDVPVLLTLTDPGAGTLSAGGASGQSVQVVTDAQGFAKATLSAGPTAGATATIAATIVGTSLSQAAAVTVVAGAAFWTSTAGVLVIAGAAAAGTAATVGVVTDDQEAADDGGDIRLDGSPVIQP